MQILVGITGGIAAYKAVNIVRLLSEAGHNVKVLPTQNALRFIGSATLEALSHNSVDPDLYTQVEDVKHIKLAQEADLVIIAPATAAFIARYANGLADDLLLNVLLATEAKVVIAPAMHSQMWTHPATQENVNLLQSRGVKVIEPESGRLTGGDTGVGRMVEPEEIVRIALQDNKQDLVGKTLLIAAGGTREPIDDVRFIGNSSSGKQGLALARAAVSRGAKVKLVAANIELPIPDGVELTNVVSTAELKAALERDINQADVLLMPVAVSDFSVAEPTKGKIHRSDDLLTLTLTPNADLIATLAKANPQVFSVAFAAEVVSSEQELIDAAKAKLQAKGVDMVVGNNVQGGAVFGSENNQVVIVSKNQQTEMNGSKLEVSDVILDEVLRSLN